MRILWQRSGIRWTSLPPYRSKRAAAPGTMNSRNTAARSRGGHHARPPVDHPVRRTLRGAAPSLQSRGLDEGISICQSEPPWSLQVGADSRNDLAENAADQTACSVCPHATRCSPGVPRPVRREGLLHQPHEPTGPGHGSRRNRAGTPAAERCRSRSGPEWLPASSQSSPRLNVPEIVPGRREPPLAGNSQSSPLTWTRTKASRCASRAKPAELSVLYCYRLMLGAV